MIDLHCHLLPGLDDGPATIDESLELAFAATQAGVETVVATPHIREDYPFDLAEISDRRREVQAALDSAGIQLRVLEGAEVAISKVPELDPSSLGMLTLGESPYMLVESPYLHATSLLEDTLFDLQLQGYRPILAHPERCPSFQREPARLATLVERGVRCSITASSMSGRFGSQVRGFTCELFKMGLVHDVSTDAHDTLRRTIDLTGAFAKLDRDLPGVADDAAWYTARAPAAMLAGWELPDPPRLPSSSPLHRLVRH